MSTECQLALTADVADAGALAPILTAIVSATAITSVTLRGPALVASQIKPLVEIAQRAGAAALIADDAELVRIVKADGLHLSWSKDTAGAYRAARDNLGARYIVGADAGRSRHSAMELGELGVDYVAFGVPPHVGDRETARERQIELIAWWSEIFEPPVVAFDVDDVETAGQLSAAGADFIALTVPALADVEAARDWIASFAAAVANARKTV